MANQANYARIGFVVVAGIAAIVATLVYLGGAGGNRDFVYVETYSDNPVSGLSVGSDVNFRGVKIGEVREISLIGAVYDEVQRPDSLKIYILMSFDVTKLLRNFSEDGPEEHLRSLVARGLRATVTASGITGLSKIELNFPRTEMAKDEITWHPKHVCIPPAPSMLDSFSDAAAKFMNQINQMDFMEAWSNLAFVAESAARIAGNVDRFVAEEKAGVSALVRTLDEAAANARDLVSELKDNPSLLIRSRDEEPLAETSR